MTQTALILGSRGRFGRQTAEAFEAAGWRVRRYQRDADDLMSAAMGCDVIVNGWNLYPGAWSRDLRPMHRQVQDVAAAAGATVIVPGNIYPYGSQLPHQITTSTKFAPDTPYGHVHADIAADYRDSGVPTILIRSGDYVESAASGNWFDAVVAKQALDGTITYPGRTDVRHSWAYLPDIARVAVGLANRRSTLPRYCDVLFDGHALTAEDMGRILSAELGRPIRLKPFPWWIIRLAAPFWARGKYLEVMRYLCDKDHTLDGTMLRSLLPDFVPTPVETVLKRSVQRVPLDQITASPLASASA